MSKQQKARIAELEAEVADARRMLRNVQAVNVTLVARIDERARALLGEGHEAG